MILCKRDVSETFCRGVLKNTALQDGHIGWLRSNFDLEVYSSCERGPTWKLAFPVNMVGNCFLAAP